MQISIADLIELAILGRNAAAADYKRGQISWLGELPTEAQLEEAHDVLRERCQDDLLYSK